MGARCAPARGGAAEVSRRLVWYKSCFPAGLSLLLRENTKWRMTPVQRGGPEALVALGWGIAVASAEVSAVAFGVGVAAVDGAGAEAAELAEARPRIKSGCPSPSWAAWSRT